MLINLTPKRKRVFTRTPHHFNGLKGASYAERRAMLVAQIATIDKLLACTRCVKARGTLNSSKNMLLGTLSFVDGHLARANRPY